MAALLDNYLKITVAELQTACAPWATIPFAMRRDNIHLFYLRLKQPLRFNEEHEGIILNLMGGHDIFETPFYLRSTPARTGDVYLTLDGMLVGIRGANLIALQRDPELATITMTLQEKARILGLTPYEAYEHLEEGEKKTYLLTWLTRSLQRMVEEGVFLMGTDVRHDSDVETIKAEHQGWGEVLVG